MATAQGTSLSVQPREVDGSRAARRLRRTGKVPGVIYGGGEDPVPFAVDARLLRQTLAHAGAVIDLSFDGAAGTPVVVKELVRHPVNGETVHLDLLRVRLDQAIHTTVTVELTGVEDSPGAKEGGVLEQIMREVNIEALPNDIPDSIQHDVSAAQINDTITLAALSMPSGVTLLDDPETTLATLSPPRLQVEDEIEIEAETELVGEGETAEEAAQQAEGGEDAGGEARGGGGEGESE